MCGGHRREDGALSATLEGNMLADVIVPCTGGTISLFWLAEVPGVSCAHGLEDYYLC